MQSKERTRKEDQKKEKTIYPFCIHDNCREAESILVAPLVKLRRIEKDVEREPARRNQPLIQEDGRKEDLSVEIGFDDDDTDDQEMLLASGLTKNEKQYILDESRELRYIDAQIKDDMSAGNQDDVDFWQQQYRGRLESLRWYMDKKGITYSLDKKKDMTEEKAITHENHEKKCTVCQKRHVTVMRSKGQERTRSRERQREMP